MFELLKRLLGIDGRKPFTQDDWEALWISADYYPETGLEVIEVIEFHDDDGSCDE